MAKKATVSDKKILLTKDGLKKLQDELEHLKGDGRKEVADRLAEAISYGDLSENSEYVEAKEQQAFVEGRIIELEEQIKSAEIIEESAGAKGQVQIGSTVTLSFPDGTDHEYSIVGSTEADPIQKRISNESPVGAAILGKKVKDKVTVQAPGGSYEYAIKKVA